jgi:signal transduction histidine kinase/DNA-binding response OmpR family regulator
VKYSIKILLVSDSAATFKQVCDLLALFSGVRVEWTESAAVALNDISRGVHDCYLVDSVLGDTTGLDLFRDAMAAGSVTPFILLTSSRESAAEALRVGVTDYLTTDRLDASELERSIRYAIQRVRRLEESRKIDEEIERRVRERTSQLEAFNTALQSEITIRKQTEFALHKQTRILHAILNSMTEGVAVADENGNFLVFNQVARTMTAVGPLNQQQSRWAEAYGCFWLDGTTPFREDELPLIRAMRGEEVDDVEMILRNRNGERFISVTARPLKDERGSIGGGLVVFREVTEQKRAREALEASLARLHSANKELEAFSYSVSHDLRTPLRHISGFVELLKESASDRLDEKSLRYLRIISESTVRMGELIDALLEFSRAGRVEMRAGRVNLSQLAAEVMEELKSEINDREVRFIIRQLGEVQGDAIMLRQVLTNLVANALKYSRTNPHTVIELGVTEVRDGFKTIYVRDNGVGFDMSYANKLFCVFQRLHRAEEFEGTGIGLASVRRIVERHGGKTWAEGAVNEGATFYFSLPTMKEERNHDDQLIDGVELPGRHPGLVPESGSSTMSSAFDRRGEVGPWLNK